MDRITEYEVVASFLGYPINKHNLKELAVENIFPDDNYPDCTEYVIELFCPETWPHQVLKLPELLFPFWNELGISFAIRIFVKDGVLWGARVSKFRTSYQVGDEPYGCETDPNREELTITKQLLSYLTHPAGAN